MKNSILRKVLLGESGNVGMVRKGIVFSLLLTCIMSFSLCAAEPVLPAFPGAEGYGANTIGGRDGRVIEITNLNANVSDANRASIRVTMLFNTTMTADDELDPKPTYILTVNAVNGSVTKDPDKTVYDHGETVTLAAVADTGYSFTNWSGAASGSSSPVTITMDSNKTATANFALNGSTYYVATNGDDSNPGTMSQPFRTIQRGMNGTRGGDTIFVKAGGYDLSGYSKDINYELSLIGEDKNSTVIRNGGTFTFHDSLTVRSLKFTDYDTTVFKPQTEKGETIDGAYFENCIFDNVKSGINTGKYDNKGTIANVHISNCQFLHMNRYETVVGIRISNGLLSDIHITNNIFKNLTSTNYGVSAIAIGSNQDEPFTRDVFISGNHMDTITGSAEIDGVTSSGEEYGYEVHGIIAYGTNLNILNNTVKNLNEGPDHEAIYMKGRHSMIANNTLLNCGSGAGGGDITAKGGEFAVNNIISDNTIISDQGGRAMLIIGSAIIENNYIKKPNGYTGIDCYPNGVPGVEPLEKQVVVTDNRVETKGNAVYLHAALDSVIRDNSLISYEGMTIKVSRSRGTQTSGNTECTGYDCPSAPEPVGNEGQPERISPEADWGIQIESARLSAGGYMIDFRFRVLDAAKAAQIFDPKITPQMTDQATGAKFIVSSRPKIGQLRGGANIKEGTVYSILFANQAKYVKSGNKITVEVGDFKAEDVVVN